MAKETRTGGREATTAVIPGQVGLSVGNPGTTPPEGFRWVRLTDIARLESGHTPSRAKSEYWDGGIPWIGIRDATGNHGRTIVDTQQHVSDLGLENSSARLLPAGTVCLSRTASVGYVVTMGVPMATSQDFVNWVSGPELDNQYLHYLLMCEQESIRRFAYGSVHPTVYYPDAKAFHVCIPSVSAQRAIVRVLAALDDKIAANSRVAHTSGELQRTKFHSLLADAVQVPLIETAQFVNGKAFTKNATGAGRMVVRIAELNSGPGGSTVYNELDVEDKHLARPGDILFAWSGSLTLHRWYRDEAIVNQHIFKVIPNMGYPAWLVFELIRHKLEEFRAVAADKATTMGHIQRRHLDEAVPVPSSEATARYDALMGGLWDRALKANEENLALTRLRDTLLPQLMSGKLRVKDAEKVVEGAV
jgi:type I restriction enzyme, S subunit